MVFSQYMNFMYMKIEYQIGFILESEMDAPMVGKVFQLQYVCSSDTQDTSLCTVYASKWCKTISE